jgi:hypothetical protein
MNMNPFGVRPRIDPGRIAEIKRWVVEVFRLTDDSAVIVTELRCTKPGCPPLEKTVIAILDQPGRPRQHKIHKALTDLILSDVSSLANGCINDDCESEEPR